MFRFVTLVFMSIENVDVRPRVLDGRPTMNGPVYVLCCTEIIQSEYVCMGESEQEKKREREKSQISLCELMTAMCDSLHKTFNRHLRASLLVVLLARTAGPTPTKNV